MSIEIIMNKDVSINDLVERQQEGFSVLRSAHVGNFQSYNMALASVGIPLLCVDHTITGVDKNYFPERIIQASESTVIAPLGRLVCATSCDGVPLSTTHIEELGKAIPSATVFTNSEYLQNNRELVEESVELCAAAMPGLFKRFAIDGVTSGGGSVAAMIPGRGVLQLSDSLAEGVLIPNELDIAINFVIEALTSGRERQYHLSGPDMVRYVPTIEDDLNAVHDTLRLKASFGPDLPDVLQVELVPTADARFATTNDRFEQLKGCMEMIDPIDEQLKQLNSQRKEFFASQASKDAEKKTAFLNAIKPKEATLREERAEAFVQISQLFPDEAATYLTQFDVAQEGGLRVFDFNLSSSMDALAQLSSQLIEKRKNVP